MQGTSANTFEPGALITREQMATMLTRALTAAKINTTVKDAKKFDDDKLIQDWARDAVYFMNSKGIIKGVGARAGYGNNCFGPLEKSTREQALLAMTKNVAYMWHQEHNLGSLATGKIANMTILNTDLLNAPIKELLNTNVVATVIDGDIVYQA